MKPPTVFLGEMTTLEVEAFLRQHQTFIVPLGSTEQHGPHAPLLTDVLTPRDAAPRTQPRGGAVVARHLPLGPAAGGGDPEDGVSHSQLSHDVFAVADLMKHLRPEHLPIQRHSGRALVNPQLGPGWRSWRQCPPRPLPGCWYVTGSTFCPPAIAIHLRE